MIKDKIVFKRGLFEFTWSDSVDYSKISPITQVYGVCFTKKEEIAVINIVGKWGLPGGKPEKGETWQETLKREVDEEADIEIKNITPLGYIKVVNETTKEIEYALRTAAIITKIKKQTIDPAHNKIPERKFIKPEEFLTYCPWGNTGTRMLEKASNWFECKKF